MPHGALPPWCLITHYLHNDCTRWGLVYIFTCAIILCGKKCVALITCCQNMVISNYKYLNIQNVYIIRKGGCGCSDEVKLNAKRLALRGHHRQVKVTFKTFCISATKFNRIVIVFGQVNPLHFWLIHHCYHSSFVYMLWLYLIRVFLTRFTKVSKNACQMFWYC